MQLQLGLHLMEATYLGFRVKNHNFVTNRFV